VSDVLMPRLSDTMKEGTIVRWLKHPGDSVKKGDVLVEIETDKATMDLEAYDEGILKAILVGQGETVPIGRPIAVIGIGNENASPATTAPSSSVEAAALSPTVPPATASEPTKPTTIAPESSRHGLAPTPTSPPVFMAAPLATLTSPLARSLAKRNDIDLDTITGSGPGGRIVRSDVEAAIARLAPPNASSENPNSATPDEAALTRRPSTSEDDVEEIPLTTIRRLTAERLSESAKAPHFSLTSVVDAEPLLTLRSEINESLTTERERISVTDLLLKACATTLRAHPEVNAAWGVDKILRHRRINIGIAVGLPDGLVVPVVHDADRLSLTEIAHEAHLLTERARAGRLLVEDIGDGTFTLSNLGMFGVDHFTAVINPPQAAILAVGAAKPEAVVRSGQVVARQTMKATLSIDHRVLDGVAAAQFLADLVRLLEHPLGIVA
jgi:pyruvate dehydrogenase E2 component (dihydrolipoamide acetyltransferase)